MQAKPQITLAWKNGGLWAIAPLLPEGEFTFIAVVLENGEEGNPRIYVNGELAK